MSESITSYPFLRCDVLLITVTHVETQAVFTVFEQATGQPATPHILREKTYYDLHELAHVRIFLVQSNMGARGPSGSTLTILAAIQMLTPTAVIMVGIAFGLNRRSSQIGDILVSTHLRDYEIQCIGTASDGTDQIFARGERPHASSWLLDRCQAALYTWIGAPVRFGLLLTGDKLVDQQAFLDQLRILEPEAIGEEMEGAGLYAAATREAETIFQQALTQIEQLECVRLTPTTISATIVNAVTKQRWTVIQGIPLAREPQHRVLPT